jgi:hypothetical protein
MYVFSFNNVSGFDGSNCYIFYFTPDALFGPPIVLFSLDGIDALRTGEEVSYNFTYNPILSGSKIEFYCDSSVGSVLLDAYVTGSGFKATNIPYEVEDLLITGSSIQMYTITGSSGGSIVDTEILVFSTASYTLGPTDLIIFNISSSGAERVSCYISSSGTAPAITISNQGTSSYTTSSANLNYTLNQTFDISTGYLKIQNNSDFATIKLFNLEVYQAPSYYQTVETVYGLNQILVPNEFDFNGELEGSEILVTDGDLNGGNAFLKFPTQEYRYDIQVQILQPPFSAPFTLQEWFEFSVSSGQVKLLADQSGDTDLGLIYAKISKTSLNGLDATPTLEDLQDFRIDILSPIGTYETHTVVSVQEQSNYYLYTLVPDKTTYTSTTYSDRLVVFSPVDSAVFINSNYDTLINNADIARVDNQFYDVDFTTNAITAVNRVNIISASRGTGSATPAAVQASNYTTARIINPRYVGSKNTSPDFNVITDQQLPSVEKYTSYFIYTPGGLGNTLAERSGSGNYKIGFLVDELGNIIQPENNNTSSAYIPNLIDAFGADTSVVLSPNTNQTIDQSEFTVYKPAVVSNIIMYSDTGSLGNNFLVSGSYPTIYFQIDPNIKFNYKLTAFKSGSGAIQTIPTLTSATASFNLITQDAAQGWTSSINAYHPPYTSLIRNSITASLALTFAGTGDVTMSIMNGTSSLTAVSASKPSPGKLNMQSSTIQYFNTSSLYWVKIENNSNNNITVEIANLSPPLITSFGIFSDTGSISANTPYWYTSSNAPLVLSSSADIGKAYQYYAQVPATASGTPLTSSGFDNPQPLNILPYDEIRFEGNEATVATIVSSSFDNSNPSSPVLYLHLQAPFDFTSVDIQYFALRRWVSSIDNLIINSPGTVMGSGFILPKYPSPTLKANLPSIIENLTNKNLV